MKTLKFDHNYSEQIINKQKTSTWRLFDDKDLSVNDDVRIVDKMDPDNSDTWKVIGIAKVTEVIEKRLGDITPDDMRGHESFTNQEEMLSHYKGYYGERVNLDDPIKIIMFDFNNTADEVPTGAMLLDEAKMYTDGGSRGNPGQSACAFVICNMDGTVVEKSGYYMGVATNNQAEYYGFKKGLERARDLGIDKINLYSDSQLVVNQMNGFYKVRNQELAPLHQDVSQIAQSFEKVTFAYVPRELNKIADKEVNRILDDQERHRVNK